MKSSAFETFGHAIQDAVDLSNLFDALNKQPPPPEAEVLKRASLVMALAALETYVEDRIEESARLFPCYSIGSRGQPIDAALGPTIDRIRSTLPSLIRNIWQSTRPLPVGFASFADAPPPNAINAMEMPFSASTHTRRGPWLRLMPIRFLNVTGEQS
jgi:hypothetical protein